MTDKEPLDMTEEVKKLDELTGKIISMALHIESTLEFFISNYFVRPQNQKTFFFDYLFLKSANFKKKKEAFKEICEKEGFDLKKLKECLDLIGKVQKIRNDLAHQKVIIDPFKKEISIGNRQNHKLKLLNSEKTLKEVEKNKKKALDIIIEFYQEYYNKGTIDERGFEDGNI